MLHHYGADLVDADLTRRRQANVTVEDHTPGSNHDGSGTKITTRFNSWNLSLAHGELKTLSPSCHRKDSGRGV